MRQMLTFATREEAEAADRELVAYLKATYNFKGNGWYGIWTNGVLFGFPFEEPAGAVFPSPANLATDDGSWTAV